MKNFIFGDREGEIFWKNGRRKKISGISNSGYGFLLKIVDF
jgi:hypothetical protein